MAERRAKLAALREQGVAYPNDFRPKNKADDIHAQYDGMDNEALEAAKIEVCVAGRMMLKRVMGKASFASLQDASGLQANRPVSSFSCPNDATGKEAHDAFKRYDIGDILGATGTLFKTRTGELSVRVSEVRLITKSVRPLPDKFHGLSDQELKYRQRYVDLIMSEETRKTFKARTGSDCLHSPFHGRQRLYGSRNPVLHAIPAAPQPNRSSLITMRWICKCSCVSLRNCT